MTWEVQYGRWITDNLDRELFNTYRDLWLHESLFSPGYKFVPMIPDEYYEVPISHEHAKFLSEIDQMSYRGKTLTFGLHPNADLTFRLKESLEMIKTLIYTQPKDAGSSGSTTPEAEVRDKLEKHMLPNLLPDWNEVEMDKKNQEHERSKGSHRSRNEGATECLFIQRNEKIPKDFD